MPSVVVAVGRAESNQRWVEVFQQLQPDWSFFAWEPQADQAPADFAVVWRPSVQLFQDQPSLQAIFNIGAGVDGIDFSQIPDSVPVYRVEDAGMAVQMAEYAVYGMLLATQRFASYVEQQAQQQWLQQEPIYRKQWPVGVMGYGQIGRQVAQVLHQLGYPVSVWTRTARAAKSEIQFFAGQEQFSAFLQQSRVLINVLPLTPQTRGIINQAALAQLQPQGFVINMARGPHIVEQDLIHMLDSGHVTGALLDVFDIEPLPQTHPFWRHPRIHVTPHISGVSLREPTAQQIHQKMQALLQNQPVSGLVDRSRMY